MNQFPLQSLFRNSRVMGSIEQPPFPNTRAKRTLWTLGSEISPLWDAGTADWDFDSWMADDIIVVFTKYLFRYLIIIIILIIKSIF